MIFIGIDPGVTGGYGIINEDGLILGTDIFITYSTFRQSVINKIGVHVEDSFTAIEQVHSSPTSFSRMFTFGVNFGGWLTTLELMNLNHVKVTPLDWQESILGYFKRGDSKLKAKETVDKHWPKCAITHEGMIDGLCLALYAKKIYSLKG